MAGDWIKMRGNLWDDPRVSRLCDITEQSEAAVIGGLYWLWATADQHTEDGVMPGLTLRQVDRKTGVQGLGQALCEVGWLADHPEGARIIRFEEHNGASAKKRCQTAKRVANHKTGNAEVTHGALANGHNSVSGALPREEKRREEKSIEIPDANASLSAALLPDSDEEKFPACPHRKLIALYAKHLPGLSQPRTWDGTRQQAMRARWVGCSKPSEFNAEGYTDEDGGLRFWDSFFGYIATGTSLPKGFQRPDGRCWRPDLEWIVNASNFAKIVDGKYDL